MPEGRCDNAAVPVQIYSKRTISGTGAVVGRYDTRYCRASVQGCWLVETTQYCRASVQECWQVDMKHDTPMICNTGALAGRYRARYYSVAVLC